MLTSISFKYIVCDQFLHYKEGLQRIRMGILKFQYIVEQVILPYTNVVKFICKLIFSESCIYYSIIFYMAFENKVQIFFLSVTLIFMSKLLSLS